MKTRVKKTFLDINKEEEWLNQQGENGLMLIGYNHGEYEFEDVSPAKYQYKIDIPGFSGSKKKDYFDFLEESGISVAGEYGGRVYLRKNRSHGPLELYTGSVDIGKQAKKTLYTFFKRRNITGYAWGGAAGSAVRVCKRQSYSNVDLRHIRVNAYRQWNGVFSQGSLRVEEACSRQRKNTYLGRRAKLITVFGVDFFNYVMPRRIDYE